MCKEYPHGDRSWWSAARFGMFIHWGLYSVPARHEWVQSREKIPPEEYEKYQAYFDPDRFDPARWARLARAAGMKYVVLTAKHHEGFCMWDTRFTDYKAKRDYVRAVLEAFRAEGLRTGLYYSLLDWHHPDFVVDCNHPLRDGDRAELNRSRDQKKYAKYMRDQVTELLTQYGPIDVIWFDFTYDHPDGKGPEDWESEELLQLLRKLRPEILIDDRLGLPGAGDFESPEQYVPSDGVRDAEGNLAPWEGCQTFSGSWGYHRDEQSWKTPKQLIEMLVDHVSRGGNLLLNVGPDARGEIDFRAENALKSIAAWMERHDRSIYGCTIAPREFPEPENCRYTWNPETRRLYVHLKSFPVKFLHLEKLQGKVKFARFLHDGSEIRMQPPAALHNCMSAKTAEDTLTLVMPAAVPPVEVPVVELFL